MKKQSLWDRYGREVEVVPSYGRHRYLIGIGAVGTHFYRVNGDCEQDAIDFIVDSGKLPVGFFADDDVTDAYWTESAADHVYANDYFFPAGNASKLICNELVIIADRLNNPRRHYCGY